MTPGGLACDDCLARAWLLARLAAYLDPVRGRIEELLALGSEELIAAVQRVAAGGRYVEASIARRWRGSSIASIPPAHATGRLRSGWRPSVAAIPATRIGCGRSRSRRR